MNREDVTWRTWVLILTPVIPGLILGYMSISNTTFLWIMAGLALIFFGIGYIVFQFFVPIKEKIFEEGGLEWKGRTVRPIPVGTVVYKEDSSSWQYVLGGTLICNSILFSGLFIIFGAIRIVLGAIKVVLS